MFLGVQIRFLRRDVAMIDVFIDAAGDHKQQQGADHHQVMGLQCVSEHDRQGETDHGVKQVLRAAHLATAQMEDRVLGAVIEERQEGNGENGGPHHAEGFTA